MWLGPLSPLAIAFVLLAFAGMTAGAATVSVEGGGPASTEKSAAAPVTITLDLVDMTTDATPTRGPRPSGVFWDKEAPELIRLVAVPDCREARVLSVSSLASDGSRSALDAGAARVTELARIREQAVAVVSLDRAYLAGAARVEVVIEPVDPVGPAATTTGPFTATCRRALAGYDPGTPATWFPPTRGETRAGTTTYCYSMNDCIAAGIDFLFIVASDFAYSPAVNALASHHASYLGLNVGIVSTAVLDDLTPESLRTFIQTVYDSESAEHFGDGRLGFVLLLGDAFADDNQTEMIPAYYGYGGNEEASDHYYACVSGTDDFEDVMLGRLPVGNLAELVRVVGKAGNYMPLPEGLEWRDSMLLAGGLFYTTKQEYVDLFDEYQEIVPGPMTVDRIYRHDYMNDSQCAADLVSEINDGHLFATFVGDGWIHEWHRSMNSTHIELLENSDRLPIVLSMACMTGWFDNTTQIGPTGSYDCFAEQLVNADNSGAIACFAAPRPTDGGVYRTLTKEVFRSAFEEHCVYLGELFATAKLLHLQSGGQTKYVRHFNLLGDPALIFAWDDMPSSGADLVVRPHEISTAPEYPSHHDELTVGVTLTNQSVVDAQAVTLRATFDGPAGQYVDQVTLPLLGAWSETEHVFVLPQPAAGSATLTVTADPSNVIAEIDETNNEAQIELFIYPSVPGFPIDMATEPCAPAVSVDPGGQPSIIVQDKEARVWSIGADGSVAWQSDPATAPLEYGPEMAVATGDLDGDGEPETAVLRRMGAAAYETDGSPMWTVNTSDPLGRPVIADADGDGDGDVIIATWSLFGGESVIKAIDEHGGTIWSWTVPGADQVSTAPVAGDFDLDGRLDVACGTEQGGVWAVSCSSGQPVELWPAASPGGSVNTLALTDEDGDGRLEIVVGCDRIVSLSALDGSERWSRDLDGPVTATAVGDLDEDGDKEVVVGTVSGTVYRVDDGVPLWGVSLGAPTSESFVIADLDGDVGREIVAATTDGRIVIIEPDGVISAEPIPVPEGAHTPYAADIDSDGAVELCVAGESGLLFVFDLSEAAGDVQWAGLGARASRTGLMTQPFSGQIDGTVVLSGEYYVTDEIVVSSEGQLTLAAGTQLTFDVGATSIIVHGGMTAQGTETLPVVLGAASVRSEWAGLTLYAGSNISLTNCRVENATFGLRGQLADVTLQDVQIENTRFGTDLSQTVFNATRCVFTGADSSGIRLTTGSSGVIRNCTVAGSVKRGIELRNDTVVRIVSTTVTGTLDGFGIGCFRNSSAVIDSCSITNNSSHGVLVSKSSPLINDCEITDNGGNGIHSMKSSAPRISRSTISGNSTGVSVELASSAILGSNMYPDTGYNSITGNTRAAVANYNGTELAVFARWNWWGSPTPYGRLFVGHVVYNPWLDAPPDERPTLVDGELPDRFLLHPNTPNPFNPMTTLRLDVPAGGGDVEVAVYDVAGRRVATLHSGHLSAGEHFLSWAGTDERGNTVATGVYFARMEASGYTRSVRMLLLK